MLNELYQYALKKQLASRPGFKPKNVKAYILLSKNGEFIGFDPAPPDKVMCPDIGSVAQGQDKCNILVEKAQIVLLIKPEKNIPVKHQFFKNALSEGMYAEPMFKVCFDVLNDANTLAQIQDAFLKTKLKLSDIIGFKVDGQAVEQSQNYWEWWEVFRKKQNEKSSKKEAHLERCLITGELTEPVEIVPKVSGLSAVGGHTSGDTLICFDKDAFCSYNLKKAYNAPVSEEAATIINAALNDLIAKAPIHAGTKFVHWYKEPVDKQYDLCNLLGLGIESSDEQSNEESSDEENEEESINEEDEIKALAAARRLIESVKRGENPQQLNNRYYIMSLSGAGGRIMVRSFLQGSYEDLYNSFKAWFDDLRIVSRSGKGLSRPPRLFDLYSRLLKKEKNSRSISERMGKELSGLDSQIMYSIINNTVLPDAVAIRALAYIRSDMLDSGNDNKTVKIPDTLCCQLLKAWLIRKYRNLKYKIGEVNIMQERLNKENPSVAYHAGRMMAVFAAIQKESMGDVGASVIQRYYASASTAPALVIGKLATLSQYHLSKIENKAFVNRYNKMLEEISTKIGPALPKSLTLEEQSQFALGYYQQSASMYDSNQE